MNICSPAVDVGAGPVLPTLSRGTNQQGGEGVEAGPAGDTHHTPGQAHRTQPLGAPRFGLKARTRTRAVVKEGVSLRRGPEKEETPEIQLSYTLPGRHRGSHHMIQPDEASP